MSAGLLRRADSIEHFTIPHAGLMTTQLVHFVNMDIDNEFRVLGLGERDARSRHLLTSLLGFIIIRSYRTFCVIYLLQISPSNTHKHNVPSRPSLKTKAKFTSPQRTQRMISSQFNAKLGPKEHWKFNS